MDTKEWLNQLKNQQVKLDEEQNHLLKQQLELEKRYFNTAKKEPSTTSLKFKIKQAFKLVYWTVTFQLKQKLQRRKIAQLIGQSGLFDLGYYCQHNPEIDLLKIDPLAHYIDIGASQGRNPNPLFDTAYYLDQNPEIQPSGINPLAHYLEWGAFQGKNPHPLFDSSYYLKKNPELVALKINPLADYLNGGAYKHRDPHPLFDSSYYLKHNPNIAVSGINPLIDYLNVGALEGRLAWSPRRVILEMMNRYPQETSFIELLLKKFNDKSLPQSCDQLPIKIGVYCSSIGNYFMGEIADLIGAAFQSIGINAIRLSENDRYPEPLNYSIIVAPHEFFYLGNGLSWRQEQEWIAQSIMVNVEQPQTSWFSRSFHFLRQCRLIFDINVNSAIFLKSIGLPAYFLPLGYLSDYQPFSFQKNRPNLLALSSVCEGVWNKVNDINSDWSQREFDLLFIGYLSQRRDEFLTKNAEWLSQYRCFLHIPPLKGPLLQGKGNALTTEAVIGLSQRSKILLNIHQSDLNYFEWHRLIFQGLWQKTLVVTEPCHPIPCLIPGEHYIECNLEDMQDKIEWLLNTPEGRETADRIRQAGHLALKESFSLETIIKNVLSLITHLSLI